MFYFKFPSKKTPNSVDSVQILSLCFTFLAWWTPPGRGVQKHLRKQLPKGVILSREVCIPCSYIVHLPSFRLLLWAVRLRRNNGKSKPPSPLKSQLIPFLLLFLPPFLPPSVSDAALSGPFLTQSTKWQKKKEEEEVEPAIILHPAGIGLASGNGQPRWPWTICRWAV